jgi:hypothetical protein
MPGQHQHPERALAQRYQQVRRRDDLLGGDAVRDHPTHQAEHQAGSDLCGQDVGQVGRRPARVQHRERHAHDGERHGARRDEPVGQEQQEIPAPEHRETAGEHDSSVLFSTADLGRR